MERETLHSKVVETIQFDSMDQVLDIQFRSGRKLRFCGVPNCVYQQLLTARSPGDFFFKHIQYRYPWQELSAG